MSRINECFKDNKNYIQFVNLDLDGKKTAIKDILGRIMDIQISTGNQSIVVHFLRCDKDIGIVKQNILVLMLQEVLQG